MTVELLYSDDCPNHKRLLPHLRELLARRGVEPKIKLRRVSSEDEALALRFLGSPTVRLDGRDIEPGAEERRDYGLKCRLYRTGHGLTGVPPDEWIHAAICARPRDQPRSPRADMASAR
jgi:hypothetical protein